MELTRRPRPGSVPLQEAVAEWCGVAGHLRVETDSAESHGAEHLPNCLAFIRICGRSIRSFLRSIFYCTILFVCSYLKPQSEIYRFCHGSLQSFENSSIFLNHFVGVIRKSPHDQIWNPHLSKVALNLIILRPIHI